MNASKVLLVAALALSGPFAIAEDNGPMVDHSFTASRTRAEVRSEALQLRAGGIVPVNTEADGAGAAVALPTAKSMLTREQVRADLRGMSRQRQASLVDAG